MNVDWISHLPGPVRAALYFGLQRAIGSRIGAAWRAFQQWTRLSSDELDAAIEHRLARLLESATHHTAYYRQLKLQRGSNESAREFLLRFPILTRETVRACFRDLVADPLRETIVSPETASPKRYDWVIVKTGGTTGVPTTVVHDRHFRDWGRATRLFSQRLCGFPLGTRYFRLWGSEQDLLQQKETFDRNVLKHLLGEIPMNAFRARENELRHHLEVIRSHPRVRHMMAYVDAAAGLARFVEDRNLPRPKLATLMACAGTVTAEWRMLLQRVFQADVFDKYGSRECADIACECPQHTGLHLYSPSVFVEVVDENGRPCPPGETGRLLITLLNNLSFPMIRYEIGDLGVWAEPTPCSCGLPFPRLASLQGRKDDMLITQDGTLLSSVFVRHFVGVSLNRQLIQEWQLEQTARDAFVFRYIPVKSDGLAENLAALQASFRKAFGVAAHLEFQSVQEIPPSPTGKTRWIINRLGAQQEGSS